MASSLKLHQALQRARKIGKEANLQPEQIAAMEKYLKVTYDRAMRAFCGAGIPVFAQDDVDSLVAHARAVPTSHASL